MQQLERIQASSLYEEAIREANRFKWLESERCRHDVGHWGLQEWARRHWATFLRSKRLEHLYGHCRYVEFEDECFGRLAGEPHDQSLQYVASRFVEDRWENLNYFCGSLPAPCTRDRLMHWLELFGINQLRQLTPPRGFLEAV